MSLSCVRVRAREPSRQLIDKHILSGLTGHCQVQLPSYLTPADTGCHTQKPTHMTNANVI